MNVLNYSKNSLDYLMGLLLKPRSGPWIQTLKNLDSKNVELGPENVRNSWMQKNDSQIEQVYLRSLICIPLNRFQDKRKLWRAHAQLREFFFKVNVISCWRLGQKEVGWVLTGRGHNFVLYYNQFRGMKTKLRKYTC